MSGDVQPKKRKDKRKKKDDLGVEEPRGTAAAFGDGDVFMHSQSDHGTGGHWCAKVIFFSLLAVLITLIGLIILENRGLTELEANSVESRYSGVLEGWIEDAPDDDHHDEHTLELKHHDEDAEDHGSELEHGDDEVEHDEGHDDDEDDDHENDEDDDHENDEDDEHENDEDDENENDDTEQEADDSEEADDDNAAEDEDDDDVENQESKERNLDATEEDEKENDVDDSVENQEDEDDEDIYANEEDDDDDDIQQNNSVEDDDDKSVEKNDDDDDNSEEIDDVETNDVAHEDEDEHEDEEEEEETNNIEVEKIEKEIEDDDAESADDAAGKDEDDQESEDASQELAPEDDSSVEEDDVEFLEPDELDELPIVEPITAPKGKPLPEMGDSPTERPQDTLADEEEYEREQEELRKEREQASQGMWLKLTIGGALLVATHSVLRRATASRETETEEEEPDSREETPLSDRRMTLIPESVPPPTVAPEVPRPMVIDVKKEAPILQSSPRKEKSEEEEEEEIIVSKPMQSLQTIQTPEDIERELCSDEEEIEEEIEEEEEDEEIIPTKGKPQQAVPQTPIPDVTKEVTPEPEDDDDVEIIDEEQIEGDLEEEEISDVDDAELLNRLEEKYGRLPDPEPERPPRHKDGGGNSIEDDWPGEPADDFWSQHLEQAQRELRQGDWSAAVETASAPSLASSARARLIVSQALDAAADAEKDNQLLNKAIAAYLQVLKMNERLSDKKLLEVATRTLDRIKFRGTYLSAEPVYKLLIRRFPNDPAYRNNLTISFLMANRVDLAENVLKETLELWPNDRVALAHHGFILKTLHNRLEESVEAFTKALAGDAGAANEPRFYYHLGDALLQLGRFDEAHKVHKRGAELGHFLSPAQRSLYNVDRLKSKPWWNVQQTPYSRLAKSLEKSWKDILKEGQAAKAMYEKEKEGLKERGEWSQLDLFVRGREIPDRCSRAPVTCGIVKSELAASACRRGQIKFSMMDAGTHVRPHVGPTNCRLRMHLGLSNTKDTYLRVDRETRQWQTGRVLMFDDSFEHEVWHNGSGARLVLIVDVWHPDLTPQERRQLPAI